MLECFHTHHPRSLTDHSSVTAKFKIENTVQGPGVFRAMPGIEKDPVYDAMETFRVLNDEKASKAMINLERRSQATPI